MSTISSANTLSVSEFRLFLSIFKRHTAEEGFKLSDYPPSFRCPIQAKGNITPAPVSPTWCAPGMMRASIDVLRTSKTWTIKRQMKKPATETAFQSEDQAVDLTHVFILH